MKDHKLNIKSKPSGWIGTMLIGFAFAVGWAPCMGSILAATLALVGANPSQGLWCMSFYILGFSVPIMIVMGVILFFDKLSLFNSLLTPIFGDFREVIIYIRYERMLIQYTGARGRTMRCRYGCSYCKGQVTSKRNLNNGY